ncbi:hypothetical protein [Lactovum odontotermitis]
MGGGAYDENYGRKPYQHERQKSLSVSDALLIMIAFGSLIAVIMSDKNNKK